MSTNGTTTCKKCHGTGYLAAFARIEFGKCFACDGRGTRNFAAERASKKAHAENLAKVYALPTEEEVRAALKDADAGLRPLKARQLAKAWRHTQAMTVWGEDIPAELAELAAEAEALLSGVSA